MTDTSGTPLRIEGLDSVARFFRKDDPKVTLRLEDGSSYSVSEQMLTAASDYFVAALRKDTFKEGDTRLLSLPGCDRATIDSFLHWCCTDELPDPIRLRSSDRKAQVWHDEETQILQVNIWAFGDAYLMPQLQDLAMATLLDMLKEECVGPRVLYAAITRTSLASKLSKALLLAAQCDFLDLGPESTFPDELGQVPGFLQAWFDVAQSIASTNYDGDGEATASLSVDVKLEDYLVCTDTAQSSGTGAATGKRKRDVESGKD